MCKLFPKNCLVSAMLKSSKNNPSAHELLPFDDMDMTDNVIVKEAIDVKLSPIAVNAETVIEPSKLSKLSTAIKSTINAKKRKKGFKELVDEENEYSDREDIHSPPTDNVTNIHRRCHCLTKFKTIICIGFIFLFFLILFLFEIMTDHRTKSSQSSSNCMNGRKVLIISLDGFRAEYLDRIPTPNIDKYFINNGVSVKSMQPVYPSKTFPNHYSIVTGLYPPSHGIVTNHFWDPSLQKTFDIQYQGNDSSGEWFKGEPIWNTVKLKGLNAATLQYPGSNANCGGRTVNGIDLSGYPSFYKAHYDSSWDYDTRINVTLNLLSSNDPVYDLVLLYFEQPDAFGHQFGPKSEEVYEMVQTMDAYVGSLMDKMNEMDLLNNTDVILLSDHGMTEIERYDEEKFLNEDSKIIVVNTSMFPFDTNDVIIRDWSPIMAVYLNESSERFEYVEDAMELMRKAIVHNGNKCQIYQNGNIPYDTFNDVNNERMPDFIVDSDLGYSIYVEGYSVPSILGTHGYNNSEDDMQAIFMARGPSFKSGVYVDKSIENVHLYELFCELMCNVEPNHNNGTQGIYSQELLKEDHIYW